MCQDVAVEIQPGSMPLYSVGLGIGTTLTTECIRKGHLNFNWTETRLAGYVTWLKEIANISKLEFWLADFSVDARASCTERWVFEAAAYFLS